MLTAQDLQLKQEYEGGAVQKQHKILFADHFLLTEVEESKNSRALLDQTFQNTVRQRIQDDDFVSDKELFGAVNTRYKLDDDDLSHSGQKAARFSMHTIAEKKAEYQLELDPLNQAAICDDPPFEAFDQEKLSLSHK